MKTYRITFTVGPHYDLKADSWLHCFSTLTAAVIAGAILFSEIKSITENP